MVNLIVTNDDIDKLIHIYKTAIARLKEGNFTLKSCNSNLEQLKTLLIEENTLVQHNSGSERFLGYNYDPEKDQINIATCLINKVVDTKRHILVQSARVLILVHCMQSKLN